MDTHINNRETLHSEIISTFIKTMFLTIHNKIDYFLIEKKKF